MLADQSNPEQAQANKVALFFLTLYLPGYFYTLYLPPYLKTDW